MCPGHHFSYQSHLKVLKFYNHAPVLVAIGQLKSCKPGMLLGQDNEVVVFVKILKTWGVVTCKFDILLV